MIAVQVCYCACIFGHNIIFRDMLFYHILYISPSFERPQKVAQKWSIKRDMVGNQQNCMPLESVPDYPPHNTGKPVFLDNCKQSHLYKSLFI